MRNLLQKASTTDENVLKSKIYKNFFFLFEDDLFIFLCKLVFYKIIHSFFQCKNINYICGHFYLISQKIFFFWVAMAKPTQSYPLKFDQKNSKFCILVLPRNIIQWIFTKYKHQSDMTVSWYLRLQNRLYCFQKLNIS